MFEFERPRGGERALLVHINFPFQPDQDDLAEFVELVRSADVVDTELVVGSRQQPDARTFIGKGKLEELAACVNAQEIEVALFNHALSPSQERNLERELKCRVLDRTGLILDIFAQRAQSFEGKLQVELAQLKHLSTRLVRGWTHLERQKGGIGLRGPGETQLETDRRLLGKRIKYLNARLARVARQREQGRQARKKADIPTVSLVGYTNAGKSTLFNRLTGAEVMAKDMLFATLDPTMRRLQLPDGPEVILSDTVGFISDLPTELVAAFRATLEEVLAADIVVHVRDISHPETEEQAQDVREILASLGVDAARESFEVWNKIDLLPDDRRDAVRARAERDEKVFAISAITGEGIDGFLSTVATALQGALREADLHLGFDEGKKRAWLFSQDIVEHETQTDDGFDITVRWSPAQEAQFLRL